MLLRCVPEKPPDGASAAASGTESTTETRLPSSVECVRSASATPDGRPIYTARVEWHTQMYKGAPMSATADAVGVGTVKFAVPTQGASFTLQLSLPRTVVAERLVLRDLRLLAPSTPAAASWSAPTSARPPPAAAAPAMSDSAPEPSVEPPDQIEDELEVSSIDAATARATGPNPPPTTATATVIASAPTAPISLPVSLIAVYAPSSKVPAGKRFYNVDVDWDDDIMYPSAKLSIHIPPLSTATTIVLPAHKPAGGTFTLQLRLPASMTEDRFALGAAAIVSGPKPVQAVIQGGVPSKRAGGGQKQPRKKAMPVGPPAPEPDFTLPGYMVQPLPTELTIEALRGRLVAHRFSTSDWPPGWCVGVVDAKSEAKRTRGLYEVNYGKQFRPAVYLHQLQPAEHGPTGNWCLVAKR